MNNIDIINIDTLKKSHEQIYSILNKCTLKGNLSLDEAFITKINLNNIYASINILEKYQSITSNNNNNDP